jgi:hypothetical protein
VKTVDQALAPALFDQIRRWAHRQTFVDVDSPYDGATYPDLVVDIPMWIHVAVRAAIAECMDVHYSNLKIQTQFFRLTTENTPPAPHGAHNDAIHGRYSAFYYINDKPANLEGLAGTSLLSHKETGLYEQPELPEEFEAWKRDTNNYDAWHIDEMVFWESNRLSIYPAVRMHRAEPPGGWGEGPKDGRLVLITFFSC